MHGWSNSDTCVDRHCKPLQTHRQELPTKRVSRLGRLEGNVSKVRVLVAIER